jgi:ribosome-associated protein
MSFQTATRLSEAQYWQQLGLENEIVFKAVLSGGKGGQNVNKVSTKVELYWNPSTSILLTDSQKAILTTKLSSKINQEGVLKVTCEESRSQLSNKKQALDKFYHLLAQCFYTPKRRIDTKPTKSSVTKRLLVKTIKKNIKTNRAKPNRNDD